MIVDKILRNRNDLVEGTFCYELFENRVFNEFLFIELIKDIESFLNDPDDKTDYLNEVMDFISWFIIGTMHVIICHNDRNDLSFIKNMDMEAWHERYEDMLKNLLNMALKYNVYKIKPLTRESGKPFSANTEESESSAKHNEEINKSISQNRDEPHREKTDLNKTPAGISQKSVNIIMRNIYEVKITDSYPEKYWLRYSDANKLDSLEFFRSKWIEYDRPLIFEAARHVGEKRFFSFDIYTACGNQIILSPEAASLFMAEEWVMQDIQLLDVILKVNGREYPGYKVINIIRSLPCADLEKSTINKDGRHFVTFILKNYIDEEFSLTKDAFDSMRFVMSRKFRQFLIDHQFKGMHWYPDPYSGHLIGFQVHEVIPQSVFGSHPLFKKQNLKMQGVRNLIYLPVDEKYHPTRSVHNGPHPDYNKQITQKLDYLIIVGEKENWSAAKYNEEISKLISQIRGGLRRGELYLNKYSSDILPERKTKMKNIYDVTVADSYPAESYTLRYSDDNDLNPINFFSSEWINYARPVIFEVVDVCEKSFSRFDIYFSCVSRIILSPETASLFMAEQWIMHDIQLLDVILKINGREYPDYKAVHIIRSLPCMDLEKSIIRHEDYGVQFDKFVLKETIDEEFSLTKDESCPPQFVMSERFRQFLVGHKLKGMYWKSAPKFSQLKTG